MTQKLVLFDLDGTLTSGYSAEHELFKYLLKNHYLGIQQLWNSFFFIIKWIWVYGWKTFILNKAYLSGLNVENIQSLGHHLVENDLLSKIRKDVRQKLLIHQQANDIIVLLTGTYDFMGKAFAQYLGIQKVEATECQTDQGRFSAKPPLQHPFHSNKLEIAKKLSQHYGIPLENCVAYGNSRNDIPLLSAVGHPVAVYPHRKLLKLALKNKWEIIPKPIV